MSRKKRRPVVQIDIATGEAVRSFASIAAAKDAFHTKGTSINRALSGQCEQAYGYMWRYADGQPPRRYCGNVTAAKKKMSAHAVASLIMQRQDLLSYKEFAVLTGWSVDELREFYDTRKLYKSDAVKRPGGWDKINRRRKRQK